MSAATAALPAADEPLQKLLLLLRPAGDGGAPPRSNTLLFSLATATPPASNGVLATLARRRDRRWPESASRLRERVSRSVAVYARVT